MSILRAYLGGVLMGIILGVVVTGFVLTMAYEDGMREWTDCRHHGMVAQGYFKYNEKVYKVELYDELDIPVIPD